MEFLSDFLSHFWAVASIIITIYCFLTVRRPKFIVVNKKNSLIVDNQNNLNIKLAENKLNSNLYYEHFLLCYIGANDARETDMEMPLSIKSFDDNVNFYKLEILKTSSTFSPKLKITCNAIEILSQSIKNGDTLELHFYADSNNGKFYLEHRYLNVDKKIKYFNEKSSRSNFFGWIIVLIFSVFMIYIVQDNYLNRHRYKGDYIAEYYFQGYKISEERQWQSDAKVDSLFKDAHERRAAIEAQYKREFKDESADESVLESLSTDLHELSLELGNYGKYYDSLYLIRPSILADSVYKSLSASNRLKFGDEVNVNNDLKIVFRNPKKDSFFSIVGFFVIYLLLLILVSVSLRACTVIAVELYYVNKVKKYIDQ